MVCSVTTVVLGVVGVVAVLKLARVIARRACGGGGCHAGGWRGRGIGRSRFLRWLFARLDTTPGQERTIRETLAGLRETLVGLRARKGDVSAKVAEAVRGDVFDGSGVATATDDAFHAAQQAILDAMRRIHEILDPKQRATLAEILEERRRFAVGPFSHGGPYRI
jgi:Spy/CpxP family protein refolding chaperone